MDNYKNNGKVSKNSMVFENILFEIRPHYTKE
jgi:hypothetical protein